MALKSFDKEQFDESRQFLLDRRCERNHPKRHRTQKRAKALSAQKRRAVKHKLAAIYRTRKAYNEAVRAYWAGERDTHP